MSKANLLRSGLRVFDARGQRDGIVLRVGTHRIKVEWWKKQSEDVKRTALQMSYSHGFTNIDSIVQVFNGKERILKVTHEDASGRTISSVYRDKTVITYPKTAFVTKLQSGEFTTEEKVIESALCV
jgi:hypothetical protein